MYVAIIPIFASSISNTTVSRNSSVRILNLKFALQFIYTAIPPLGFFSPEAFDLQAMKKPSGHFDLTLK